MRWWLSCSLHPTMELSMPENLDSPSRYSSTTSSFIHLECWTVTSPILPSLRIISPHGFSHIEKRRLIVWVWTSKFACVHVTYAYMFACRCTTCLRIHDVGMHYAIVNYSSVYGCLSSYDFTFWVSTAYTRSTIFSLLPSIIYQQGTHISNTTWRTHLGLQITSIEWVSTSLFAQCLWGN